MAARRRRSTGGGRPRALNESKRVNNGNTAPEDSSPAKKTRRCQRQESKKMSVAGGKANKDRTEDKQDESVKALLLKGKAPADPECTAKVGKAHVYCEGNDVYDVMLNQDEEETKKEESLKSPLKPESQLDLRVQELIKLICNVQAMEEMMMEMKYNTKKAPLGKLTVAQIKAGYQSLKKIEDCIRAGQHGRALMEACNEFYTRIPHNFGLRTPPLIRTQKELSEKIQLLEALGDIEIAIKLVKTELQSPEHPLDQHYRNLHCALRPLDHESYEFKVISQYLQSTHAPTHSDYTMTLLDLFEVEKEGEKEAFREDLHNRMLLWHGSRLSNWVGILSHGLRIAPPEAPITGYMFGKGIYFADMSSKSANYCFASRLKNTGLLLLSEVALGQCNELLEASPKAEGLLQGKHSTKGLGKMAPSSAHFITLNGSTVPLGPASDTGILNPDGYTLNYNEYIVYNPNQVRMRYLLKVQFNFLQLW
ncbi:poly [ADP-ribose] polymerase 2 isoform X4 [Symphalangus syndactylus]|uniref:poly [ADP-ribose] polymerase 2 isoform X4 n=1 Tax=Symphalangus syndactylus TaxID=9590 RepID=UPI0030066E81